MPTAITKLNDTRDDERNNAQDAELLKQYCSPNNKAAKQAFNKLYERHSVPLYTYLFLKCKHKGSELANDICQDTWVAIIEHRNDLLTKVQTGQLRFKAYLFTIARNKYLDYYKQHSTIHEDSLDVLLDNEDFQIPATTDTPDTITAQNELIKLVIDAINQLPKHLHDTVHLYWILGLDYATIAEQQGLTKEGVRSRIKAASKLLQPLLAQWELL